MANSAQTLSVACASVCWAFSLLSPWRRAARSASTAAQTVPSSGITPPPGAGDTAPQISGSPATSVIAGNGYSFTPTASDADNDTLSFSVTNLPDWASFDASTGALTGTPPPASIGSYPNISISVSDGQLSTALAPFAIQVIAPLTLSGNPPTEVAVGTPYDSSRPPMRQVERACLLGDEHALWATFNPRHRGTLGHRGGGRNFREHRHQCHGRHADEHDGRVLDIVSASPTGNHPPTISGEPANRGPRRQSAYSFTPTASIRTAIP